MNIAKNPTYLSARLINIAWNLTYLSAGLILYLLFISLESITWYYGLDLALNVVGQSASFFLTKPLKKSKLFPSG